MTTTNEALKLALEALERAELDGLTGEALSLVNPAITAIKKALMSLQDGAQQSKIPQRSEDKKERSDDNEQVEPAFWYRNEDIFGNQEMEPIFYATKAWVNCLPLYTHPPVPYVVEPRTAQPKELEQEPKCIGKAWAMWGGPVVFDPPLAQPEQEPMAWAVMKDGECLSVRRFEPAATSHADGVQFVPLYTTPPQRKPLTDEEERKACEEWCYSVGLMQKSHGVISINSQVEAVWMAWKARAAHGIKEAA